MGKEEEGRGIEERGLGFYSGKYGRFWLGDESSRAS